ncbi:hypothetical protein RYH80_09830 [Halobaculum sp. MBLA0147]|uniref:DUF7521 family protein n=1 Tax=Halobaculum sp. MBLA0147 TaxID=3079934 RepID=UPI00352435DB
MIEHTLQLGLPERPLRHLRLLGEGVGVLLGLVIAYIALRGYYQNRSRAMLFVGVGFLLVLGVPAVATLLAFVVPVSVTTLNLVIQGFELAGLGSILYGLRYEP